MLLMALGGELRHAAFRFSSGPFTLSGIRLEEILRIGFQVLQMDAVILRLCLLVVSIGRFRSLAEIIRICSIADDAAAAGVCGPGDDCPCRSGPLNTRTISNLYRLRLWWVLRRRSGGSRQAC